jgi:putative ABC transport system permease protein
MFKNYLKIALRNIKRYKGYSFINIAGLAVGMACCILILLWVRDELNFDRFHHNLDHIHRVIRQKQDTAEAGKDALTPPPLAAALKEKFPGISHVSRFGSWGRWLVTSGEKKFYETRYRCADPDFFEMFNFPFIKGNPKNALSHTYSVVLKTWSKVNPGYPFEYRFLDEQFHQLYLAEARMGTLTKYFTVLGIVIACLGLFGLASFMAEQRTKEIGIRKALGASVSNIILLLSREFTKLVLVATIIAWPIAYFTMNHWLQNFAYRVSIGWWVFVFSAGLTIIIAFLTVSYQSIKAATANPLEALKYE